MKHLLSLVLVTALLAFANASFAYPSLAGPTGTGVMPDALVVPSGQLQVAADVASITNLAEIFSDIKSDLSDEIENGQTVGDITQKGGNYTLPFRMVYGLGGVMEAGGGVIATQNSAWDVNAKIHVPLLFNGVSGAVGTRYAVIDSGGVDRNTTQFYGVISEKFPSRIVNMIGSVGLNWTEMQFQQPFGATIRGLRPFISISNGFVSYDYQFKRSDLEDDALYSIVIHFPITAALSAELGLTNVNPDGVTGGSDSGVFFGFTYGLGGK